MDLRHDRSMRPCSDKSSEGFMSTNERSFINGNGIGQQIVKIGGDGSIVPRLRHHLGENRISVTWFGFLHRLFKKCISHFLVISETTLVNRRIKACTPFETKSLNSQVL